VNRADGLLGWTSWEEEPTTDTAPTKAELRAAVEELDEANRAIAPVIRWKVGGGDHPIFADYRRKLGTLNALIDALNIPEGDET
jgi:hypothetical protein